MPPRGDQAGRARHCCAGRYVGEDVVQVCMGVVPATNWRTQITLACLALQGHVNGFKVPPFAAKAPRSRQDWEFIVIFQFTEPTGGPIDFEDSLCNLSGLEGSGRTLVCSVSRKRSAPDMPMQSCEAFDVGAFTLGFHAVARIEPDLLVFAGVAQFPDSLTGGSKSQVARSLHEMNQTQIKYFKAMQVGKYTDSV